MDRKSHAIETVKSLAEDYHYALAEVDRLRDRLGRMCVAAHREGASDREISEASSLSRARIQQLRTEGKK